MSDGAAEIWRPPVRPPWVEAINRGEVLPMAEEAALPMERDRLLAEALVLQGRAPDDVASYGSDDFIEPLDVFVSALEEEAELHLLGRWMTRRFLLRLLTVRLQLMALVRADPGVVDEVIDRPVVVAGAPRTGTTVLHRSLAQDPANRAPEGWELLYPVPPPEPGSAESDPRVALAGQELSLPQQVSGTLESIHRYSSRMLKECLSAMSFSFRTEEFVSRCHVPSYVSWLQSCDMTPAYDMHKLVLQVLQRRMPPRRWVLKSPVHMHSLPVIRAVYPDAPIVLTHRDPQAILASVSSLIASLRWAFSDSVDMAEIGRYHLDLYGAGLDRLVDHVDDGTLPRDVTLHLHHGDITTDPAGAVSAVYDHVGWSFDQAVADGVGASAKAEPVGAHGTHRYRFEHLGLDTAEVEERTARYRSRFVSPG